MKIQQEVLIDNLQNDVEILLKCVESFREERDAMLIPPTPGQWSIAQNLEHLNTFGRHYLPEIDKAICTSHTNREAWFNSGFLGNLFTNMMKPKNVFEVKNKMKTFKSFEPQLRLNADKVLNEFEQQQHRLIRLLGNAKEVNLNSSKIPITISKLIRLNLGDTFRFLIAHEQRHFIQARNALHTIGLPTNKFPVILQAV